MHKNVICPRALQVMSSISSRPPTPDSAPATRLFHAPCRFPRTCRLATANLEVELMRRKVCRASLIMMAGRLHFAQSGGDCVRVANVRSRSRESFAKISPMWRANLLHQSMAHNARKGLAHRLMGMLWSEKSGQGWMEPLRNAR
jgi:hypothetical protein